MVADSGRKVIVCIAIASFGIIFGPLAMSQTERKSRVQFESQITIAGKMENGKAGMEMLLRQSKLPRVGECWKEALEDLQASCGELDDDMQSRMALAFTGCFLEMTGSGFQTICQRSAPIKDCLANMDNYERDTFRDYFLHTQDMCYYLQSQLWHHETERAVNGLQDAAIEMGKTVQEQKILADSILESQQNAQQVQQQLLKDSNQMFEKVKTIKIDIAEFGENSREHRAMFGEIFDKLRQMQHLVVWIQGEMSLIDLASFYVMCVLFSYFLTAAERTQGARVWMILTLALALCLERYLYSYWSQTITMSPEEILLWVQYYRRAVIVFTATILMIHLARYQDYQVINNTLLTDMRKRMDDFTSVWETHYRTVSMNQSPILPNSPATRQLTQLLRELAANGTLIDDPAPIPIPIPNETETGTQTEDESTESEGGHQGDVDDTLADKEDESDSSLHSSGDDNDDVQTPPPSFLQQVQRGGPMAIKQLASLLPKFGSSDENNSPGDPPTGQEGSEPKYNLRDRRTLQSPNQQRASVEPEVPKPAKRSRKAKTEKQVTGYYSSDDDI